MDLLPPANALVDAPRSLYPRHVEIDGHEFPFSRGVSFYEFDSDGKMLKARDVVEGAVKPGTATLRAIGVLAPLMRKLGPRASPAYLPTAAAWGFYAGRTFAKAVLACARIARWR